MRLFFFPSCFTFSWIEVAASSISTSAGTRPLSPFHTSQKAFLCCSSWQSRAGAGIRCCCSLSHGQQGLLLLPTPRWRRWLFQKSPRSPWSGAATAAGSSCCRNRQPQHRWTERKIKVKKIISGDFQAGAATEGLSNWQRHSLIWSSQNAFVVDRES